MRASFDWVVANARLIRWSVCVVDCLVWFFMGYIFVLRFSEGGVWSGMWKTMVVGSVLNRGVFVMSPSFSWVFVRRESVIDVLVLQRNPRVLNVRLVLCKARVFRLSVLCSFVFYEFFVLNLRGEG